MNEFECSRCQGMMAAFVDGDLAEEQSAWLRSHREACAECRGALAQLTEIDSELTGWGERLEWENPALPGERERLEAKLNALPVGRRAVRRNVAMGLAVAAAIALAVIVPQRRAPVGDRAGNRLSNSESQFIEIPYLAPLDPQENATIVRMDIQVATLLAAGFRVMADPDTVVPADVLVGEDGRAHAVRVLSDVGFSGAGD